MRLKQIRTIRTLGLALLIVIAFSISVFPSVTSENNNEETEILTGSDWFTWTMNGTHHSVLAITNESLNWTHSIVSIYNEIGAYKQPSFYNAVEYESDLEMNHTNLENGTHSANITLYHNETVLANHNWSFYVGSTVDSDNDGIIDNEDSCPDEDSRGYDANADGCIDDSDNDSVKDDVDICPFDANDGCPAALANEQTESECFEGDVKNEDCNSCTCNINPDGNNSWACTEKDCDAMAEDSPNLGFIMSVIVCLAIATRKRN